MREFDGVGRVGRVGRMGRSSKVYINFFHFLNFGLGKVYWIPKHACWRGLFLVENVLFDGWTGETGWTGCTSWTGWTVVKSVL